MESVLLKIIQTLNEMVLNDRIVVSVWTQNDLDDLTRYYYFIIEVPNKNYKVIFSITDEQFKDKDVGLVVSDVLEKVKRKLYGNNNKGG